MQLSASTQLVTHSSPLTLLVRGLSMRGLPFSLVCAHLETETLGRSDKVVLNLDNMLVDGQGLGGVVVLKSLEREKETS